MADLKKTLPPSVGAGRGIGAILDSCDSQLDLLEGQARAACLRLAAGTADERGLELWERELGLDVRTDLSIEARRTLIRIALEQMDTCTPQKVVALLGRMLEGECTLREDFGGYTVYPHVQVTRFLGPSLRQVEKALRRVLPAQLDCRLTAEARLANEAMPGRVLFSGMKLEIFTEEDNT